MFSSVPCSIGMTTRIQEIDSWKAGRKARKKNEMFGDINDPDLKREFASGQTQLISYIQC